MSGGHLVDAVTHQVDMIRYIAGEYSSVFCSAGRLSLEKVNPDATIYDASALSFTLKSGTVGSITESCFSPFHTGSEIKFFGADFFVHIELNGKKVTIVDKDQNETFTSEDNASFVQDRAFFDAILSGSQKLVLSNYADGMKTLEFSLAANRSAVERKNMEFRAEYGK